MDPRAYGVGAQILRSLGVKKMRLHTNSQPQLVGLGGFDLHIEDSKHQQQQLSDAIRKKK